MSGVPEAGGRRRVVVGGLGIVSPLGIGIETFWKRLAGGDCALGETPPSTHSIPVPPRAATLAELVQELEAIADDRALRRVSNLSRYAVAAAKLALERSGRSAQRRPGAAGREAASRPLSSPDDTCVLLGTCYGSSQYHFDFYERLAKGGLREASPILFSESVMNSAPGHISLQFKLHGASLALVGGEEVGLNAVVEATERILVGDAAAVLAGGAEEYCDFVHAALASRDFVSAGRGEPYAGRDQPSFVSEGAAVLLLEEEGQFPQGAAPLAEVRGLGASRAREDGAAGPPGARAVETAVRRAMETSGIAPDEVDLVVSSATGGEVDAAEAEGLARAFARRDPRSACAVAACKAALGEGFAFSSAAQAVVAVKALVEGVIPPTPGAAEPALLRKPFALHRVASPAPLRNALAVSLNRRGAAVAIVFGRASS